MEGGNSLACLCRQITAVAFVVCAASRYLELLRNERQPGVADSMGPTEQMVRLACCSLYNVALIDAQSALSAIGGGVSKNVKFFGKGHL